MKSEFVWRYWLTEKMPYFLPRCRPPHLQHWYCFENHLHKQMYQATRYANRMSLEDRERRAHQICNQCETDENTIPIYV